jgi:hypothetical protein
MHVSGGWLDVEFSGRMRAHRSTSIWEYVPAPPALKIDKWCSLICPLLDRSAHDPIPASNSMCSTVRTSVEEAEEEQIQLLALWWQI